MKRFMLTAALITGLFSLASAQARSLDEIQKSGTIIVASEGAYAPFNFFKAGKLSGFEIDLAEAVVKKMGLKLEWKSLSFDALLAGLRQDRWDMVIASFGVTDERSKAVDFTHPHYCSGGVIVSKGLPLKDAAALAGKTVAVQTGSTYMEKVKKLTSAREVKNFPQDTDARSALVAGRVDAWVSDRFVVKNVIETNPALGLKIGGYLFIEKIAIAIKKDNAPLAAAINKALADVMADGTYKTISEKYFKEDIRCRS